MELHVDPRLRTNPSNILTPSSTITSTSSPSPASNHTNRHPSLPSLPRPSLAENPVRLPPPTASNLPSYPDPSPQQPYYQLPPAVQTTPENHDGSPDGPTDPKRPRACESCRGLKVRCESDANNLDGPCRRCAKAGRNCVVTVPSRKRQKKTDSRVAELEKKIDALTASLHATRSEANDGESDSESNDSPHGEDRRRSTITEAYFHPDSHRSQSQSESRYTGTPTTTTTTTTTDVKANGQGQSPADGALKRKHHSIGAPLYVRVEPQEPCVLAASSIHASERSPPTTTTTMKEAGPQMYPSLMPKSAKSEEQPPPMLMCGGGGESKAKSAANEYADVIDRQVVSADLATSIFNWYVTDMAHHFPAVVFPPGTTAAEIRKTKPILFLAILAVASGFSYPDLQRILTKEVMKVMAERIFLNGEKSLELVQSLHVSTLWYYPPEHHEELKFYQLIHIAAVMAIDLGMGKKAKPVKKNPAATSLWRDHPRRRGCLPSPQTIESRRCWLSCYFLGSNVSQSLRRPNLIRWSSYMDDCVDVLTSSDEALPSDRQLCHFVRLQHIADEIGYQFSMDDPCASVGLSDLKVQYALKNFERQLEEWNNQLPKELDAPSLRLNVHIVSLYMHEVALHVDHNIDDFHPPFTEETLKGAQGNNNDMLTPVHIDALTTCLASIHGSFDTFMSYTIDNVRTLPIFYHVRTAYCVVVLIKMYFAASAQNGELGKVINRDHMKVEQYLDNMMDRYRQAAEDERCRPAGKFLMVLVMLKTWFMKQKNGPTAAAAAAKDGSKAAADAKLDDTPRSSQDRPGTQGSTGSSRYPQILSGGGHGPAGRYADGQGQQGAQQQPDYSSANTPLQLLSEVAMGNQNSMPHDGSGANAASGNGWYGYNNGSNSYAMNANGAAGNEMPNGGMVMSADGMFENYGISLGDDEFSNIFMDDVFLNMTMDGGGTNMFENFG